MLLVIAAISCSKKTGDGNNCGVVISITRHFVTIKPTYTIVVAYPGYADTFLTEKAYNINSIYCK